MTKRIVIKLGGATLFHPTSFQGPLTSLLNEYPHSKVYLIAGGGDLIESMRTLHHVHTTIDSVRMHWRCIELLDHTFEIANELYPLGQPITTLEELDRYTLEEIASTCKARWVRVQAFYSEILARQFPSTWQLKCNWDTTTDALAWLLARIVNADRLLLLKRIACDSRMSMKDACDRGIVDVELARLDDENGGLRPQVELRQLK